MSAVTNSTSTPPGSLLGAEDLEKYGLPYLQSVLTSYRPEAEILFSIAMFSPYLARTFSFSSPKRARARGYPYLTLLAHILSSLFLVTRYHARYVRLRVWPEPETADLLGFSLFFLTSFYIEAYLSKNQLVGARVGFQTAILMHCAVFTATWAMGGDTALFRTSVKLLNWFSWFRLTARVLPVIDRRLRLTKNFGARFELTCIMSTPLALWESGYPNGIPIHMGLVSVLMVAEHAVAAALSSYPDDHLLKKLVLASGYVDFGYLKEKASQSAESKAVGNGDELKVSK
ncbi:hypothetical protein VPNG_06234 [Cytospora leucostoma]|uniref:Uncharacterized protein n=1 Tax=Cytospora leucostoma TaxID=1230097 RepID=A0A423WYE2_9PEZI|nr:hypothetical protein VPNG_06234 [Cytospora leucostoma]